MQPYPNDAFGIPLKVGDRVLKQTVSGIYGGKRVWLYIVGFEWVPKVERWDVITHRIYGFNRPYSKDMVVSEPVATRKNVWTRNNPLAAAKHNRGVRISRRRGRHWITFTMYIDHKWRAAHVR